MFLYHEAHPQVGFSANRRLLDVQKITQDCSLGEAAFRQVTHPVDQELPALSADSTRDPGGAVLHAQLRPDLATGLGSDHP